jgi:hypothetical protein
MSRVSKLQYVNKDFTIKHRDATNKKICILAWRDSMSALKPGQISTKKNCTHIKKNVRREYPEFTDHQCELARESAGEWFKKNKHLPEWDKYRKYFPNVFDEKPFKQAEILFDTVETVAAQEPEEVETVRHYQQMGAKQIETPSGFKIQF